MFTAITVLIIIICILLVLVVLVQNPKGGGVASGIIGANQLMGVKNDGFHRKLTWGLVIGLVSLCLLAGFALPKKGDREIGTKMQEQIDAGAAPTTTWQLRSNRHNSRRSNNLPRENRHNSSRLSNETELNRRKAASMAAFRVFRHRQNRNPSALKVCHLNP